MDVAGLATAHPRLDTGRDLVFDLLGGMVAASSLARSTAAPATADG